MNDEIVVIAPVEVDIATAPGLGDALQDAISEALVRVVVDLRSVTFLDSSGLNALVRAKHVADAAGVELVLQSPSGIVRTALAIGRLDEILKVREEP